MVSIRITNDGIRIENENQTKKVRNKGKSLLQLPKNYSIIDIETTGLSPEWNDILEVSSIRIRNNEVVDKFSRLLKPDDFNEVDPYIEKLTGISTNMILESGGEPKEVLGDFLTFVGSDTIIGHNVNFDINFLYDNIKLQFQKEFTNDFVDTYRLSKYYAFPTIKKQSLINLSQLFDLGTTTFHRSLADSFTTFEIYNKILSELGDDWVPPRKKRHQISHKASDVVGDPEKIDIYNPFYNANVVFTGKLTQFTRANAQKLIANIGGNPQDGVNKSTNYLVSGVQDSKVINGDYSSKQIKAMKLKQQGQDINIIDENIFIEMLAEHLED